MLPGFERLFTRFLLETWERINSQLLLGALKTPQFEISDNHRQLGSWDPSNRRISISGPMMLNHSALEVEEVLRHEMAHQYVDEVLNLDKQQQTPHGDAFRHACLRLEIVYSAKFRPKTTSSPLMERIRKLLALAESANQHEAELAMAKAQQLMHKYELEMGFEDHDFRYCYMGGSRAQRSMTDVMIAGILVKFFQIRAVWITTHTLTNDKKCYLLELSGTETQLEIAHYVWDFLQREVEYLWKQQRRINPTIGGKSDKRDFIVGVLKGLQVKMERAEQLDAILSNGRELMQLKSNKLEAFLRERHPRLRNGGKRDYRLTERFYEGYEQGQNLDIHKGISARKGVSGRIGAGKT